MRGLFETVFLSLAFLGHAALWVGLVNRIHSAGMPRWLVKSLSLVCLLLVPAVPLFGVGNYFLGADAPGLGHDELGALLHRVGPYAWWYVVPCAVLSVPVILAWARRRRRDSLPSHVRLRKSQHLDIAAQLGFRPVAGRITQAFAAIPANQICQLQLDEYEIELPHLAPELDGLSIVHLSDLHFTGHITFDYFGQVIKHVNAWQPDIIMVTGDLIDDASCFDWLSKFFGQLQARHGVFFVLGNHDLRTHDLARVRRELTAAGCIDLGGRWQTISIRGQSVLLAGNELPWIAPAADMQHAFSKSDVGPPLRILLSHSPDQFAWAERWSFDLMLCGHTHGGQVCLPVIGPTLSPSWHGVQYSAGTFYRGSTTMHVSRGTSGDFPLRWNCPPEVSLLVLRRPLG